MADTMVINVDESNLKTPETNSAKKLKRKRSSPFDSLNSQEIQDRIVCLREELDGLFGYYREITAKADLDLSECGSVNSMIACLLEASDLPLSKLVDEIYEKVKMKEGVTVASVKSSVLLIGQRLFYGVANLDADVLEDDTQSCLWCWETREVKLMPKSMRGALKVWRTCRKKIHERITAVSAMIAALQKSESHQASRQELMKASERLGKVLSEADIRLLAETLSQKGCADSAEKAMKRENKLLIKQLEKNKREAEKEKKKMDLELQKEKLQSEKELKRLQDEAEKEERRREKEESEMKKQLRKQQEEAEKEQKRREKEEAEMKKQLALQKQASLMERFIKRSKTSSTSHSDQSPTKLTTPDPSPNQNEKMPGAVTLSMDSALSLKDGVQTNDLWKSHLNSWRRLGHSIRSSRKHWGIRQKPKTELVKELKLTTSREMPRDDELGLQKLVDEWGEEDTDDRSCHINVDVSLPSGQKCNRSRQLLQFDKSNRPAFYGIWSKKSQVVGPRHPLVKDADLDYEIDSDEEWEEEEPGESLSDCDKDEEESVEEGSSKPDEEDESEDGFFVPDGYLSENEGVQVDRMDCEEVKSSPCHKPEESEEIIAFYRQQKYLHNLTERALRKNRPMIISNFAQVKDPLLLAEFEQTCLQALSMLAFPIGPLIEISVGNNLQEEEQEASQSNSKGSTPPVATSAAMLDSDLSQIVSIIQSCSQGINKVVESLHQKFPTVPKSHLRNKVREIANFVDNRWQVKKDVLNKLGLSISPEKGSGATKSIATFFSKRCLPPSCKTINPNETSPKPALKPASAVQPQQSIEYNQQSIEYNQQ